MDANRTETNDLSKTVPERPEEMVYQWEPMTRRFNALPWPC